MISTSKNTLKKRVARPNPKPTARLANVNCALRDVERRVGYFQAEREQDVSFQRTPGRIYAELKSHLSSHRHLIVQQVHQFRYMLNVAEVVDHLQAPFNLLVAHLSPRHQ